MADKKESRRDGLKVEAVNPVDGSTVEVFISSDRMQAVGRRSMAHAKECGFIVPMILQKPTAIFEGLRRDEDEDRDVAGWLCYCGVPPHAYHADGTQRDPFPNQVYLVFVNENKVAYNWRWEEADPNDAKLPQNHEQRFKKRAL